MLSNCAWQDTVYVSLCSLYFGARKISTLNVLLTFYLVLVTQNIIKSYSTRTIHLNFTMLIRRQYTSNMKYENAIVHYYCAHGVYLYNVSLNFRKCTCRTHGEKFKLFKKPVTLPTLHGNYSILGLIIEQLDYWLSSSRLTY